MILSGAEREGYIFKGWYTDRQVFIRTEGGIYKFSRSISVIVNGGGMLPKLGERHLEQPSFINEFLRDYFSELREHNITCLAMLGNDDLLAVDDLFDKVCGEFGNQGQSFHTCAIS